MSTIRFTSKEAFVAALEDRRAFWRTYDDRRAREHAKAEQKWLKEARTKLRDALKLDYDELTQAVSWNGRIHLIGDKVPECPVLMEHKLNGVLDALAYTQARAFTVAPNSGPWQTAYELLTKDPDAKVTVC